MDQADLMGVEDGRQLRPDFLGLHDQAAFFFDPGGRPGPPDACDGGEQSSASSRQPSSAPSSRQRPSADDRDHQGATFHGDADGDDRSPIALR